MMHWWSTAGWLCLWLSLFLLNTVSSEEDFYKLLGVSKDADDRSIRRAFKKLALQFHPDKNKDDENAHDTFVRINRAYEILKDEELRKKYDLFGEKGLEDSPGGQNYQSWNFYKNNFGIYDEDAEIVTMNRADFEQSVLNSEDRWFVNFYSTGCSHCHELAPAWREMARELEGVIRIGAVNCEEDWTICQGQGVFSYPSLVMYPERMKYQGPRDQEQLVEFAMKRVKSVVLTITGDNLQRLTVKSDVFAHKPWLIDFCDVGDNCLSSLTRRKVAAMLNSLANVGTVDCVKEESLCEKLDIESGIYYFPAKHVTKDDGLRIESLDAKELAFAVLAKLPDMVELAPDRLTQIKADIGAGKEQPWLVEFAEKTTNSGKELELRKLPALLVDMKIGRVNCSRHADVCKEYYITKHPTFVVFKPTGGYEIHHGRTTVHDIVSFARECAKNNVRVLDGQALKKIMGSTESAWFVDFFTPWCPPCMRLLPEFRKASRKIGNLVKFGTVDCTVHQSLCQQVNVHSYPTTILYNQTQAHSFVGLHSVDELVEFVEDVQNPPVMELNPDSFVKLVKGRKKSGRMWVVDFFAPWCGPCQQLAPEFRKLAKMMRELADLVSVASIDCEKYQNFCQQQYIQSYPTIRLYPSNKDSYVTYQGWMKDAMNMRMWIHEHLPSKVEVLSQTSFLNKVLAGDEPWLVDFYAPWCGHCQIFAPEFEKVARKMTPEGVKFGKVNCDQHFGACQVARVQAYPTVRLYKGAEDQNTAQDPYGNDVMSQNADQIINILRQQLAGKLKKSSKPEHTEL